MENSGEKDLSRNSWAGTLNLLVPGLGIICLGWVWTGLGLGLFFAACANLALWATLLIPDDLPRWGAPLAIGLGAGAYLGAQMRFVQVRERLRLSGREAARRTALITARDCLEREDYSAALAALTPIRDLAARDLLVAYRLAQVLTGLGDAQAALHAWRQVQTLDRHRIYREEWRPHTEGLLNSIEARRDPPAADSDG